MEKVGFQDVQFIAQEQEEDEKINYFISHFKSS